MAHTRELKPPPELVEAIQQSEDMTAPPSANAASDLAGPNIPRTVRNRLAHEDFAPMTEAQRDVLEERAAGADHSIFLGDHAERRAHEMEVRKEQESAVRVNRDHLTAGTQGPGPNEIGTIMSNERPGAKGPHYRTRQGHHTESMGQH